MTTRRPCTHIHAEGEAPLSPPSRTAGQTLPAVALQRSMIKLPVDRAGHTMSGHAAGQRLENVRGECKE
jgi:hypothetical protein